MERLQCVCLFRFVAAMLVQWAFWTPGDADAKCWPNRADNGIRYHDGWLRAPGVQVVGVRSRILNYDPWVQPGRFSTAWAMLQTNPSTHAWAQIGWVEYAYDERYTLIQYTTGPNQGQHMTWFLSPQPEGQLTYYQVERNIAGQWDFRLNGYAVLLPNPVSHFVPNMGSIAGEINSLASQMPGGYSNYNYEWLDSSQLEFGGAWQPFHGELYITPGGATHFGNYVLNSDYTIGIYDKKCPS